VLWTWHIAGARVASKLPVGRRSIKHRSGRQPSTRDARDIGSSWMHLATCMAMC
jgi:hypothetical protein